MEKNFVIEQITKVIKVETEFSVFEESAVKLQQTENKSLTNLKTEEQVLKTQLENLKKKNFSLKAIIQAWKTTYEQKQNELAEAESKLQNKIYDEIWSEREEFCSRAEKFSDQYGILSKWWRERINEAFTPLVKANEKLQGKVDKLEKRTEEVQKEVVEKKDKTFEVFVVGSQQAESFISNRNEVPKECSPELRNGSKNPSPDQECETIESTTLLNDQVTTEFNEGTETIEPSEKQNIETSESTVPESNTEIPKKKKVRFSKENEKITIFYENPGTLKMKFFSIVDTETVRKANRFKNKQKNQLFGQAINSKNKVL